MKSLYRRSILCESVCTEGAETGLTRRWLVRLSNCAREVLQVLNGYYWFLLGAGLGLGEATMGYILKKVLSIG